MYSLTAEQILYLNLTNSSQWKAGTNRSVTVFILEISLLSELRMVHTNTTVDQNTL